MTTESTEIRRMLEEDHPSPARRRRWERRSIRRLTGPPGDVHGWFGQDWIDTLIATYRAMWGHDPLPHVRRREAKRRR